MLNTWTTKCADCDTEITYADSTIVSTPVERTGKTYPGMTTHTEKRVCEPCAAPKRTFDYVQELEDFARI